MSTMVAPCLLCLAIYTPCRPLQFRSHYYRIAGSALTLSGWGDHPIRPRAAGWVTNEMLYNRFERESVHSMHRRNVLKLLSAPVVARFPGWSASVKSDRVVIAGSGIIGASIAYHLAKRGAQVTVLEKQRPGAGATEKSFAWINATFSKQPRAYYELNSLGIAGWRRLHIELGNALHIQWGGSVGG